MLPKNAAAQLMVENKREWILDAGEFRKAFALNQWFEYSRKVEYAVADWIRFQQ
jgi:hypothetical protein